VTPPDEELAWSVEVVRPRVPVAPSQRLVLAARIGGFVAGLVLGAVGLVLVLR